MLRLSCLLHFLLTGLSGLFFTAGPQLAAGIHLHGLIGVLGFGYTAFLHLLVTPRRFGAGTRRLRGVLALLSLLLLTGALLNNSILLNGAGAGYLLATTILWRRFRAGASRREDLFLRAAVIISILSWIYFLYSWNFTTLGPLESRFSHILLALSFPLSLLLFSRYLDLLEISSAQVNLTLAVLVGGVLTMFSGLLLGSFWLEIVSAGLLLLLITLYLLRAGVRRDIFLLIAFSGLLLTGVSGIWYVLAYGHPHGAMILAAHAHLAHFAWATYGIFFLLLSRAGYGAKVKALFLGPLLLALAGLVLWMLQPAAWLLTLSLLLFLASGLCLPLTMFGPANQGEEN